MRVTWKNLLNEIIVTIEMLTKYSETWFSGADNIPLFRDK